nr:MAG TPA: hypothetical protein [Caudoviricetes sp.]
MIESKILNRDLEIRKIAICILLLLTMIIRLD